MTTTTGTTTTRQLHFFLSLLLLVLVVGRTFASSDDNNNNNRNVRIRVGGRQAQQQQQQEEDDDNDENQHIVGGTVVQDPAREFPSFTLFANGECGGTLVSPNRVLTAAHCVQGGHPSSVRVGATTRTDGIGVRVRCAKSHPLYVWPDFQYDIAVLKLDDDDRVAGTVPPAVLNSLTDYPRVAGQNLTVVGLGRESTAGASADKLVRLDYQFVPDEQCKKSYDDAVTNGLHICAKGMQQGACFGDSGGPLFDNIEPITLVGVVTGASGGCADNKIEDVYADVAAFRDWILEQNTDETCDDECVGCLCEARASVARFGTQVSNTFGNLFRNFLN